MRRRNKRNRMRRCGTRKEEKGGGGRGNKVRKYKRKE
jgi:hypothetical protein